MVEMEKVVKFGIVIIKALYERYGLRRVVLWDIIVAKLLIVIIVEPLSLVILIRLF